MQPSNAPSKNTAKPRRGRPTDPQLEVRLLDAALYHYGRVGWAGFNMDGVAREANVSKGSLYNRWPTRSGLLAEAFKKRYGSIAEIDTGSVREDLLRLARLSIELFSGDRGAVFLQLRADAERFEEVKELAGSYIELMVQQGRMIVKRAKARYELPPNTKPAIILDTLVGGILNHVAATPPHLREKMFTNAAEFAGDVVDMILFGVERLYAAPQPARPQKEISHTDSLNGI